MTDIVVFNKDAVPATSADIINGLAHIRQTLPQNDIGSPYPYLRLLKTGMFAYGRENIEVEKGSEWAVNPASIEHGFVCWGEGELLGIQLVPCYEPVPVVSELPNYGKPWQRIVSMQLQCLLGTDKGTTVIYRGPSYGFLSAANNLIGRILQQITANPVAPIPVVTLEISTYKHKKYGETNNPVFNVVRWIGIDGKEVELSSNEESAPIKKRRQAV
jgi:hypothetical protein